MFIDEVVVDLAAGNGGSGCMSFRREKFLPKGGPNGGNGGKGGDLIVVCNAQLQDLTQYRFVPHARAENGQPGRGSDQDGRNGKDCIFEVPRGTILYNEATGNYVSELTEDAASIVLLKGGKGGKGNTRFKSSTNQAPRQVMSGLAGEFGRFRLVLKSIAHFGLVGFPNAGKSSLLTVLTQARPKIADYKFTTLWPHLGVMLPQKFILADIPGLIAGAHKNKGLGHRFLKHIERCQVFIFVLDVAVGDPNEAYETLLDELSCYDANLLKKPRIIVANKMDLAEADHRFKLFLKSKKEEVIAISTLTGYGLDLLKKRLEELHGATLLRSCRSSTPSGM